MLADQQCIQRGLSMTGLRGTFFHDACKRRRYLSKTPTALSTRCSSSWTAIPSRQIHPSRPKTAYDRNRRYFAGRLHIVSILTKGIWRQRPGGASGTGISIRRMYPGGGAIVIVMVVPWQVSKELTATSLCKAMSQSLPVPEHALLL